MRAICWSLQNHSCKNVMKYILLILGIIIFISSPFISYAEGSKDFINYPGYRLFFFAQRQQQLKVFANEGEFLNIGASHVGIKGGFIQVFRPDGSLHSVFDNTGATEGLAIINNDLEEKLGPIGGGTVNGAGYKPGVVEVGNGETGVWTVTLEYPSYTSAPFTNLLNSDPWTRLNNQPLNQRVVLAWDITVSQNAAGNDGGNLLVGRVFTNEYQSIVNYNGNRTSPSYFILTKDGYLYQIDFNDVDPWGFPIFSNTWGIVNGDNQPTYSSFEENEVFRSADVNSWNSDEFYLYEPQAEDNENVINNKIFFNQPNPDLPAFATTTDIYRNNTHTTWLYKPAPTLLLEIEGDAIVAADEFGNPTDILASSSNFGAYVYYNSTLSGTIKLTLDLNFNDVYGDEGDVQIYKRTEGGQDSVYWNGMDANGIAIPIQNNLQIDYTLEILGGELHILMGDIENNVGGVTFSRINGVNAPDNKFFYDHSRINGAVSGGGTPGNALETTEPFIYSGNWGNERILDHWSYVDYAIKESFFVVDIFEDPATLADDSDGDGIRDDDDIDDDNDGIPDVLELCYPNPDFLCLPAMLDPSDDEDEDLIPNYLDADDPDVGNTCIDNNNDGICDKVPSIYDWDEDGVPNHLDLDSDNDAIPDMYEAGHALVDADGNAIIDGDSTLFIFNGLFNLIATDSDDLNATITYTILDSDNDGVPNFLDLDSDNDGIYDIAEAGFGAADPDNDGRATTNVTQMANWGLPAVIDPSVTNQAIAVPVDTDQDAVPNYIDHDSDNDGISDVLEGGNEDPDNDGVLGLGIPTVNANGVVVANDGMTGNILIATSNPPDSDNDAVPNYLDHDSDNDGIHDVVEGGNEDPDNDGVLGLGVPDVNIFGAITSHSNALPFVYTAPNDSDADGVPDCIDLDSDNDGIYDVTEAGNSDPDNDGIIGTGVPNVNALGIITSDAIAVPHSPTSSPLDSDNDGIFNYIDHDSDNDGIGDVLEGGNEDPDMDGEIGLAILEVDENGVPIKDGNGDLILVDYTTVDTDTDGVLDYVDLDSDNDGIYDVAENGNADPDNDGIIGTGIPSVDPTGVVISDINGVITVLLDLIDTDGDGIYDAIDQDSDNDGIADVVEGGNEDPDNDGILGTGIPTVNENGVALTDETGSMPSMTSNPLDTDEDGVPDFQDLDSDNDGIHDVVEAGGTDPDNDGILGTGPIEVNSFGIIVSDAIAIPYNLFDPPIDTDADGVPDFQDLDSDNDGIYDVAENGGTDPNNDGIVGTGTPTVNQNGQVLDGATIISTSVFVDTDNDNVPNSIDADSDNDGIADVVEGGNEDPDNDGILGTGIPTVDENGVVLVDQNGSIPTITSNPIDTDGDGVVDILDLDSDNDGIHDVVEAGGVDPDNDGLLGAGPVVVNENGVIVSDANSTTHTLTANPLDTDGDGYPNFLDLDSDNDGINDVAENGGVDPDNDGIIGTGVPTVNENGQVTDNGTTITTSILVDTDGDGVVNTVDLDSDNDGIHDVIEAGSADPDNNGIVGAGVPIVNENGQPQNTDDSVASTSNPNDTDEDGVPDFLDLDSDNDSISDVIEGGNEDPDMDGVIGSGNPLVNDDGQAIIDGMVATTSSPIDTDNDGVSDFLDLDADNDGIHDVVENINEDPDGDGIVGIGNPMVDENGLPLDENGSPITNGIPVDTNNDGIPDYVSHDSDGDGILDVIEGGFDDPDGDGIVGTGDPVVDENGLAIQDGAGNSISTTSMPPDTDEDGMPDFQDIDSDNDSIADHNECPNGMPCPDTDNDGVPNFLDPDSDDDGINDGYECPTLPCVDTDNDGDPDIFDLDSDDDGLADEDECPDGNPCPDFDGDGADDFVDVDSDDDGLLDEEECPDDVPCPDFDGDGNPDHLDPDCSKDVAQPSLKSSGDVCEADMITLTVQDGSDYFVNHSGSNIKFIWRNANGEVVANTTQTEIQLAANDALAISPFVAFVSVDGCQSDESDPTSLVIYPNPVAEAMISADRVCEGSSIQLMAQNISDATYKWTNSLTGEVIATTPTYTVNDIAETTNFELEVTVGNCSVVATDMVSIEVEASPEINFVSNSATYCEGGDVLLSANSSITTGMITYTWTDPNNVNTSATINAADAIEFSIANIAPSDAGTYQLVIETESGCVSVPETIEVMVDDALATPELGTTAMVACEGSELVFALTNDDYPSTGVNYVWYYEGQIIETTDDPNYTIVDLADNANGTYSVEVQYNNCTPVQSLAVNVEVIETSETPNVMNDRLGEEVCEGETVILEAPDYGDIIYEWYKPNGNLFTEEDGDGDASNRILTLSNIKKNEEGEYYVQIRLNESCDPLESEKTPVKVHDPVETPILTTTNGITCSGEDVMITIDNPYTGSSNTLSYDWYFVTDTDSMFLTSTTDPMLDLSNISADQSGTYYVQIQADNCSSPSQASTQITVTQLQTDVVADAGPDHVICGFNEYQLQALTPSTGTGQWTIPNGVIISDINDANAMVSNLAEGVDNVFVWSLTDGPCTNYSSDEVIINISTTANEVAYAGADEVVCGMDEYQLQATMPINGTGQWISTTGATITNSADANTMVSGLTEGIDNIFIWQLSDGDCINYTSDTVIINFALTTDAATIEEEYIQLCSEGATTDLMLEATVPTTAQGQWTLLDGNAVTIENENNYETNVTNLVAGTYVFEWSLSQGDCEGYSTDQIIVEVTNLPQDIALAMDDFNVCSSDAINIQATTPDTEEVMGFWSSTNPAIVFENPNDPNTTVNNLSIGENTLSWTLSYLDCTDYSSDVLVIELGEEHETLPDTYDVELNASLEGVNVLINDAVQMLEEFSVEVVTQAENGEIILENDGTLTYVPNNGFYGQDQFIYQVCNERCDLCEEAVVTFRITGENQDDDTCFVPNIITPNGDGYNDALEIPCTSIHLDSQIKIFNRWGDKVYESNQYRNDWIGDYRDTKLPAGTYFYLFQKDPSVNKVQQGYITIIR